jgi:ankyrin repeat protein
MASASTGGSILSGRVDPLLYEVQSGNRTAVEAMLHKRADPNYADGGRSLLCIAAESGKPKMVQLLLDWKADPNIGDPPPLITVMSQQELPKSILKKLLYSSETNPNIVCKEGLTPLGAAVYFKNTEGLKSLLKLAPTLDLELKCEAAGSIQSPLAIAAVKENPEAAEILLKAGAKPNAAGPEEVSALHCAISAGDVALVKLLLGAGADPEFKSNIMGTLTTPMMLAAREGWPEVVNLLLDAGADPRG